MMDVLAMNGYGGYVWSSFGLTAAVLVWNVIRANRDHAQMKARLIGSIRDEGMGRQ